ncbi:MAG: hypothetical protein HOV77_03815 [Hamadaea sp.]|uniref:hypothetical protein n=1 Tax=Hamadaea sp. TaxID=2024425 RepID=UPI0017B5836B|nr:hypothetical protein [Hamadaea sp.]NUS00138.1 hypothetical protein [Kribbellaceae bacterium]NUT18286.1 hypothetical protein [Hamadaea sp.]
MTTPSIPSSPGSAVKALRPLFAWALLGYVALHLFFTFFGWLLPSPDSTISSRSVSAGFVTLYTIVLPLLALLIATQITPILPMSKLMAAIALVEYLVAIFFGFVAFVLGLGRVFDYVGNARSALGALEHLVMGLVDLGIAALAAYAVLRIYLSLGGTLPDFSARHTPPPAPPASTPEPPTQQLP